MEQLYFFMLLQRKGLTSSLEYSTMAQLSAAPSILTLLTFPQKPNSFSICSGKHINLLTWGKVDSWESSESVRKDACTQAARMGLTGRCALDLPRGGGAPAPL